jgi:glyoxylase-like metal-dependent hydrolase (beta-lactamase superfamily II)
MKISEHCYAITGLAYIPPLAVNAGLIAGDTQTLIIDTGATLLSAQTIYGYAQSVRPANTIIAINTEQHLDHIGGNAFLRSQGIDIWGHVGIERCPKDLPSDIEEFNDTIQNRVRRAANEAEIVYSGTGIKNPNHKITSDTTLDLGGLEVQILLTPGHTPTNISIFLAEEGVLFCGDCLIRGFLPNLEAGTHNDWKIWLASLDRVEALGAQVIVPGHGPVIKDDQVAHEIQRLRHILHESISSGIAPTL